jgi:hypothetical protein
VTEKLDKLGRRIPDLDRSAIVKKSEKTKKKKYGKNFHARIGAVGGSRRGRGYFGKLKDEGKTNELQDLARKAAEKSNKIQSEKKKIRRDRSPISEDERQE